eukprot:782911-Prymnesium_polylepis.1
MPIARATRLSRAATTRARRPLLPLSQRTRRRRSPPLRRAAPRPLRARQDGTTRRKLARASGAIMEYVGQIAFICGSFEERTRARTYLKWLLKQRNGSVFVEDLRERTDVTIVPVPSEAIGYVTGNRGSSLRQ